MQAVIFVVDGQRFALRLSAVQRVVRAVAVTPLPGAPEVVLGAIDVAGTIVPVLDVRRNFRAASHEILIATTARRTVALLIDEAHGVVEHDQSAVVDAARIAPGLERFHGVVQLEDGLALIHDLDAFLSLDEARALDDSIERHRAC
jgi:purine-binding chemotaxis protein CheW